MELPKDDGIRGQHRQDDERKSEYQTQADAEPTGAVLAEAGPESYGPAWEHLEPADSEVRRR